MNFETLKEQGYITTDGSSETLQLAKKINNTTWLYREWLEAPFNFLFDQVKPVKEKISLWDNRNWREEEIDILDYSKETIEDAVVSYGYIIEEFISNDNFSLSQNGDNYSIEDSIQLACECIFELEY